MESQPSRPSRGRHGFYEHDPTHGFESDMTAEEIFNMFFGGGEIFSYFSNFPSKYTIPQKLSKCEVKA